MVAPAREQLLPVPPPFHFRDLVFAHGWLRLEPYLWDEETETLARTEQLPTGEVVQLSLSSHPLGVLLRTDAPAESLPELVRRARWMLALDEEFAPFHALCGEHPGLAAVGERGQGRILRCPTVWEDLVKTLFSVNTTWGQTIAMTRNLVQNYGAEDEAGRRAFPAPDDVARVEPAELQSICRVGYRAEPLSQLALGITEGRLDLEALKEPSLPSEEVEARLRSLRGIGPYAAANVLMLLGRYDHLPVDSWFRATVRRAWFDGRDVPDRELIAAFEPFRPYRTLAWRFYDWRGADGDWRWPKERPLMSAPLTTMLLDASNPDALPRAAEILLRGGLVAIPTETVYGLGALGLNEAAVERIFQAKERPHSDPLILHVAEAAAARLLVAEWPAAAEQLARAFWPGPLTLVLPKSDLVPLRVTAGQDSVAVRVPAHPVALELLRAVGQPVAAPSANRFGRVSPTLARHVLEDLDGRIDAVLDGGPTDVGVESTVLDLRGPEPVILRPGGVTREMLETVLDAPVRRRGEVETAGGLRSPGLLTRHYSPRAELHLFAGLDEAVATAVRELEQRLGTDEPLSVLAYEEDLPFFEALRSTVTVLGHRANLPEVTHALYQALRAADETGARHIAARLVPPGGLGDALNDRLTRAASGRVIRVK